MRWSLMSKSSRAFHHTISAHIQTPVYLIRFPKPAFLKHRKVLRRSLAGGGERLAKLGRWLLWYNARAYPCDCGGRARLSAAHNIRDATERVPPIERIRTAQHHAGDGIRRRG